MKSLRIALVALCLCAPWLAAAEPVAPPPIRFPVLKAATSAVQPAPAPEAVSKLTPDVLFVVESDVDVKFWVSPASLVDVQKLSGPVVVYSKFSDGDGSTEQRTFKAKWVYLLKAPKDKSGTAELIVDPVSSTDESASVRKTVTVESGAPKPAPTPKPDVVIPDGRYKLGKTVNSLVYSRAPQASATKGAAALAASYESVVKAIDSGELVQPKDILLKTTESNREALKKADIDKATWEPFFTEVKTAVYGLYDNGSLVSKADFRDAWVEIAAGLKAVR